jgi:serine/threonine protein kinase
VPTRDFDPSFLVGTTLGSEFHPGVTYRMDRLIGEGGMGVVFFAIRDAPEGVAPVVIKVVRPSVVGSSQGTAGTLVKKEVVALSRLNERVPQTPFVVRFIDTGSVDLRGVDASLPWIAVEHVHGGVEGTTLEQRVEYSVKHTGSAFDPTRVGHALRCLGAGVAAIHDVKVLHRDITPGNVLCCGFGEAEIFKISDFGLARMESLDTFGEVLLGTPGYAAPEQNFPEQFGTSAYSDVFSLACVAYYLFTGEAYFEARNAPHALMLVTAPERKSILSSRYLSQELRSEPGLCREIDAILAAATAMDPRGRPQHAQELTGALVRILSKGLAKDSARASQRLVECVVSSQSSVEVRAWSWSLRHPPGDDVVLHGVAWESDGHALAATTRGLSYWTGTSWVPAPVGPLGTGLRVRSVHRTRPGTWVLGADETVAVFSTGGVSERIACPGASFQHLAGHLGELLVGVSDRKGAAPELFALEGGRFHPPLELSDFTVVSAVGWLGEASFLVAGRRQDGSGGVSLCRPLERTLTEVAAPPTRAFVAGAAQPDRELGLAVGTQGVALSVHPGGITTSLLEGEPNLSACAVDILDREWAASAGRLWVKEPGAQGRFRPVWENASFVAPFVSVFADIDVVLAVTADGGVLEGRAP